MEIRSTKNTPSAKFNQTKQEDAPSRPSSDATHFMFTQKCFAQKYVKKTFFMYSRGRVILFFSKENRDFL